MVESMATLATSLLEQIYLTRTNLCNRLKFEPLSKSLINPECSSVNSASQIFRSNIIEATGEVIHARYQDIDVIWS